MNSPQVRNRRFRAAGTITRIATTIGMALVGVSGAWAGSPLGPDAQLFGLFSSSKITLAHSSTVSDISQAPAPPKVGASTVEIAGPTSYLTGDLIAESFEPAIVLGAHDTVVGACITGGGTTSLGVGASCGSIDTTGGNQQLITASFAFVQAEFYAGYLAGLTPTTTLGDITLKKYQRLTVKLTEPVNVVAIGNITTAGGNTITLSAPKGAVVVLNVSGVLNLGAGTQVFNSNGLNTHNVIWNLTNTNPTFGTNVTLNGTVINFPNNESTVTFGAGSSLNGAVLVGGDIEAKGAMHLNFWPFTAAP
jgi:choice-of-anchor A domain-containing protein